MAVSDVSSVMLTIYVCMCVCVCVCVFVYVFMYVLMYVYIYIYIYIALGEICIKFIHLLYHTKHFEYDGFVIFVKLLMAETNNLRTMPTCMFI